MLRDLVRLLGICGEVRRPSPATARPPRKPFCSSAAPGHVQAPEPVAGAASSPVAPWRGGGWRRRSTCGRFRGRRRSASGTRGSSPCRRHSSDGCAGSRRVPPWKCSTKWNCHSGRRSGRGRCPRVPTPMSRVRPGRRARAARCGTTCWSRSKSASCSQLGRDRVLAARGSGTGRRLEEALARSTRAEAPEIDARIEHHHADDHHQVRRPVHPEPCGIDRGHSFRFDPCIGITSSCRWRTSSLARPASSAAISSSACSRAASACSCWCGRSRWRSSRPCAGSGVRARAAWSRSPATSRSRTSASRRRTCASSRARSTTCSTSRRSTTCRRRRRAGPREHRGYATTRCSSPTTVQAGCFHHASSIAAAGLYQGSFRENMFEEATGLEHAYFRTKHESEALVRSRCQRPWRVYRPGIVVGHSQTGQIDKIDGPYYFFKMIQKLRQSLPPWFPLIGLEGGYINLVPVDYVAAAMDHLAHLPGPGRPVLPPDRPAPAPRRRGAQPVRARGARADHGLPPRPEARRADPCGRHGSLRELPAAATGRRHDPARPAHPARRDAVLQLADALRLDTHAAPARGRDIRVPMLEDYAWRLWDYWERHLDPDLSLDRSLAGAVRGKVVLITGGSSGIGLAAAERCVDAGAKVLIVARDPEKLEAARAQARRARQRVHAYRLRPLGPAATATRSRSGARRARRRRFPGQQRRALDPPLDRPVLRPLPRLRAHHAAQLLRGRAPDHGADARRCWSAAAMSSTSRRSACCRTRRASRPTSPPRRRWKPGRAARRPSSPTAASRSRSSTCRWCARR